MVQDVEYVSCIHLYGFKDQTVSHELSSEDVLVQMDI